MSDNAVPETREERFCRAYVRLPLALKAATFAGYDSSEAEEAAHRLLTREDIQNRIALLRHEQAWRQCHDMDAMLSKLQALYEQTMVATQYGIALRALTLQARIAVLVDDRGRGTQGRRERPVSWAWSDLYKQVGPEESKPGDDDWWGPEESAPADDDWWGPEPPDTEEEPDSPPHPVLSPLQGGEGSAKEDGECRLRPLSIPGGGKGCGAAEDTRLLDAALSGDAKACKPPEKFSPDSGPLPFYAGDRTALPSDRTSVSRAATLASKNTSLPSTHRAVVSSSPG